MPLAEPAQASRAMASGQAMPATSRRTTTVIAVIATSIGSSGATATAICSAIRPPKSGVKMSFSAAIGRSTSRDQWMFDPASRCWERSYQPGRRAGRGPA